MIIKAFHRHLLPIILTPILLMCGWLVVDIPILFVFIIDDAFKLSELLTFMFYAISIGLGISVFVAFPLTLLVEKIFPKSKVVTVLISGFMFLVSVFLFMQYVFKTQSMLNFYPWSGILLLLSFALAVYLLVFSLPNIQKSSSTV